MSLVRARVSDERVNGLIVRYLKAGMLRGDILIPRGEGTPQGGPLSPLLANLLLDQLDKELERRKHRFVRYADDCNIYVKSRRAGQRVKASITRVPRPASETEGERIQKRGGTPPRTVISRFQYR